MELGTVFYSLFFALLVAVFFVRPFLAWRIGSRLSGIWFALIESPWDRGPPVHSKKILVKYRFHTRLQVTIAEGNGPDRERWQIPKAAFLPLAHPRPWFGRDAADPVSSEVAVYGELTASKDEVAKQGNFRLTGKLDGQMLRGTCTWRRSDVDTELEASETLKEYKLRIGEVWGEWVMLRSDTGPEYKATKQHLEEMAEDKRALFTGNVLS